MPVESTLVTSSVEGMDAGHLTVAAGLAVDGTP
jgi:hypothetical protein